MVHQPNIIGDTWFNSKPLTPDDLKGKVVLVDFWTYSCANCQRTILYLKKWWQKYKDKGLVIVGIHTPEFEFEKDSKNVEQAIHDLGVTWPVVLDNDYTNWNNFANHYWPAKYLVDQKGNIVYSHFGEGAYEETEREILKYLGLSGFVANRGDHEHGKGAVCFIATPETYCGYKRGHIANTGGYREDKVFTYVASPDLETDSLALSGRFVARPEYVESDDIGAALFLHFRATEVNLVMDPGENPGDFVSITLNGASLPDELRGIDVGESGIVKVSTAKLYNLFRSKQLVDGVLGVKVIGGKMRMYAFTFSGCEV